MQIGSAEPPLASFLFALSFYGESLSGRGYVTALRTDALQAPLDRARGELSSDTRTLIFHLKIIRGKIDEIWRSEIAIDGSLDLLTFSLDWVVNSECVSTSEVCVLELIRVLRYHGLVVESLDA